MSKGPEAFRTISEVAEELDLPQHVLRFWETRFTQIRPLKRGGGRRYYRPDDVDLLRGIQRLLYGEGYTIRGVQRILHEQGLRFVVSAGRGGLAAAEAPARGAEGAPTEPDQRVEPRMSPEMEPVEGNRGEETFDPRAFRADLKADREDAAAQSRPDQLSPDEIHRLQATLSELLELKRLLDHVR